MNYHLHHQGQNLGIFPLAELQARRDRGELTGAELVWCEGMVQWQTLNSVLPAAAPRIVPPVLQPTPPPPKKAFPAVVAIVVVGLVILALALAGHQAKTSWRQAARITRTSAMATSDGMVAASQPVVIGSNAVTEATLINARREFRLRQYVEGYKLRGERNPTTDARALGYLQNWVDGHFGGPVDTNLPPLDQLGDELAANPAGTDPVVLTVAGVNAVNLFDSIHRLDRAVKGFEHSKHLAYPKLYATVMLADKLREKRDDDTLRLAILDKLAVQRFSEAFADGSIRPADQPEVAAALVGGWGDSFMERNSAALAAVARQQGDIFHWLALVLAGESEINLAWQARGGGYINTVTAAGAQGFSDHLALARQQLTEAWNLRPDLALAPNLMIYVSLGDAGIDEMRVWFDRAVAAQFDFAPAWQNLRWGLRPRWYGSPEAMLAFGRTELNTRRFDTDVPRMYFESVENVEEESGLPPGRHLYQRADIWPDLQMMYEGYLGEPSQADCRDGWHTTYAAVAYLAGKYDVARAQLEATHWQPWPDNLKKWGRDLSLMPLEVAARTGPQAKAVQEAEFERQTFNAAGALKKYQELATLADLDDRTRSFVQERIASLTLEKQLRTGRWVPFLPTDTNLTGWNVAFGNCHLLPDGSLEVHSGPGGHLLYSRARVGADFEMRGQFEVVSSTSQSFQGGLVMGFPEYESWNWYAFRIKRNADEGDVTSFSHHWTTRQLLNKLPLDRHTNTFTFRFQDGQVTAGVNGQPVLMNAQPPRSRYRQPAESFLGLGAFNDGNTTVIRYRNVEARQLTNP